MVPLPIRGVADTEIERNDTAADEPFRAAEHTDDELLAMILTDERHAQVFLFLEYSCIDTMYI